MTTWHRWVLFGASVPCMAIGMLAIYEAAVWMRDPAARCAVFAGGVLIFGVGLALVGGAARRD